MRFTSLSSVLLLLTVPTPALAQLEQPCAGDDNCGEGLECLTDAAALERAASREEQGPRVSSVRREADAGSADANASGAATRGPVAKDAAAESDPGEAEDDVDSTEPARAESRTCQPIFLTCEPISEQTCPDGTRCGNDGYCLYVFERCDIDETCERGRCDIDETCERGAVCTPLDDELPDVGVCLPPPIECQSTDDCDGDWTCTDVRSGGPDTWEEFERICMPIALRSLMNRQIEVDEASLPPALLRDTKSNDDLSAAPVQVGDPEPTTFESIDENIDESIDETGGDTAARSPDSESDDSAHESGDANEGAVAREQGGCHVSRPPIQPGAWLAALFAFALLARRERIFRS
jgi:hypothetical protein